MRPITVGLSAVLLTLAATSAGFAAQTSQTVTLGWPDPEENPHNLYFTPADPAQGVLTEVQLLVTGTLEPQVAANNYSATPVTLTSSIGFGGAQGVGSGPNPGTASGDRIIWTQTVSETPGGSSYPIATGAAIQVDALFTFTDPNKFYAAYLLTDPVLYYDGSVVDVGGNAVDQSTLLNGQATLIYTYNTPVPEPASLLLLAAGLFGLARTRRRGAAR